MTTRTARAAAGPNIALIKYWGNRGDPVLRLAASNSISLTLDGLWTEIRVRFDETLQADSLSVNDQTATGPQLARTSAFLDIVRSRAGLQAHAAVDSQTNFPVGAGIASSAAAFAALALAASHAAGLRLTPPELSRLARRGSGSACRSIYGGFVEWIAGPDDETSQAEPLFPPEHWELIDLVALIGEAHKPVGSTEGHALAGTSPLQDARLAHTPQRLAVCRDALRLRDFARLAAVVELDSNMMHAVMLTSSPPLVYWQPATVAVVDLVSTLRRQGVAVCTTIDAGPSVHCLCAAADAEQVSAALSQVDGVLRVLRASPGAGARLLQAQT